MKLSINIKPTILEGRTKGDILNKIRKSDLLYSSGSSRISSNKLFSYSGLTRFMRGSNNESVFVYNLQKNRRKVKQVQKFDKKLGKNVTKSVTIKKGHWIAYLYEFNIEMLKQMGAKKIYQESRTFKITF